MVETETIFFSFEYDCTQDKIAERFCVTMQQVNNFVHDIEENMKDEESLSDQVIRSLRKMPDEIRGGIIMACAVMGIKTEIERKEHNRIKGIQIVFGGKVGRCCACGYEGEEETRCPKSHDHNHCDHWKLRHNP